MTTISLSEKKSTILLRQLFSVFPTGMGDDWFLAAFANL